MAVAAAHQRIRIIYRTGLDRQWDTEVDPWSVVMRFGRWYLLCFAHHVQAVRTYRIDRIQQVETSTSTFATPQDLNPVAVLKDNLGTGWAFATRVVFHAPIREVSRWFNQAMVVLRDRLSAAVGP